MFKFLHVTAYLGLSFSYAGASAHVLDKDIVTATTAVLYLVLALDEWRKH